jgi:hypothetical protein
MYGDISNVEARDCIRAGASSAEAKVSRQLPEDRRLEILRTVQLNGRATASYTLDGARLSAEAAEALLEEAFGARLPVAAKLSMMFGGGHVATQKDLNLEGHLYEAFGVDPPRCR